MAINQMTQKKNSWVARELSYLLLAPLLVLIGILAYGILLDRWYKDPELILEYSGFTYGAILILRFVAWVVRAFSS